MATWKALLARLRASAWGPVVVRIGAVVIALAVLGWIGRTAAARPGAIAGTAGDSDASTSASPSPAIAGVDAGGIVPTVVPAPTVVVNGSPPTSRGRASLSDPVYLNHASVDELRRLPGVGPKRAEAILVLRQRIGRFQRVEDLLRVKGVGRGAVKKWRPLVRLDAPPAPDAGST